MSRYTKSDIERALKDIAEVNHIPTSRDQAILQGKAAYIHTDYYSLPDNPYKWKLCVVSVQSGGEWDFPELKHSRLKTSEMYWFLAGLGCAVAGQYNAFENMIARREAA